jgi:hypothetical protein
MILHHITLSSGHVATHRLDVFAPGAVAACKALLPTGGPVPAFPAFRVEIAGPVFTIYRGREPIVTCGLGNGPEGPWRELCNLQRKFLPVEASRPLRGRWLAVVLLPSLLTTARSDIEWLGDFERVLAAAMLEGAS